MARPLTRIMQKVYSSYPNNMERIEEKPIGIQIRRTSNLIKNYIDAEVERRLNRNITGLEAVLLRNIARLSFECTSKKLQAATGASKAALSEALKNLERKGFLRFEGSSKDRRVKHLLITEQGKEILQELSRIFDDIEKNLLSNVSKEDLETTIRTLSAIRGNANVR